VTALPFGVSLASDHHPFPANTILTCINAAPYQGNFRIELFEIDPKPNYNVAPTQMIPVVAPQDDHNVLREFKPKPPSCKPTSCIRNLSFRNFMSLVLSSPVSCDTS